MADAGDATAKAMPRAEVDEFGLKLARIALALAGRSFEDFAGLVVAAAEARSGTAAGERPAGRPDRRRREYEEADVSWGLSCESSEGSGRRSGEQGTR
jgi:hypothetical protein